MKYKEYKPNWNIKRDNDDTYRTMFRWGNPDYADEPTEEFYSFVKEKLSLSDEDFMIPASEGENVIDVEIPVKMSKTHIKEFEDIVGKINVATDTLSRVKACYSKGVLDNMRLRGEILENLPDAVISPSSEEQLLMIVKYCYKNNIPIYVMGGGTNITRSNENLRGGIKIDLKRNLNKIISFSAIDQTVTVMAGITGPQLEEILNNANEYFTNVNGRYTIGHIPESFEFSTVGGWVASRSIGQNSMRYGGIDDILLSSRYITPKGIMETDVCTRDSCLPAIDEIMLGSEGKFGILVSCTLKVRKYTYETKKAFSYVFKNWESAVTCARELVQREICSPSFLRVCDKGSTEIISKMSKLISKGILGLRIRGENEENKCLLIGYTEGDKSFAQYNRRAIGRLCTRFGGVSATSYLNRKWDKTRFNDAYIRDILQDYSIVVDKFVCPVKWSELQEVYSIAVDYFNEIGVLNMFYLQDISTYGAQLVISYARKYNDIKEYKDFHNDTLDMLIMAGVKCPHSYSIGRTTDRTIYNLDEVYTLIMKTIKKQLDSKNILNP